MNTANNSEVDHIASELALREPLFHNPQFGTNRQDFDPDDG